MRLIPASNNDSYFREFNPCHAPAGSPDGGQFCSQDAPSLRHYPRSQGSARIPEYLKADVLKARQAGIEVFHSQQPEPVVDTLGYRQDPLALSHAEHGEKQYWDAKTGLSYTGKGRVYISTRGGEYDPMRTSYEKTSGFWNTKQVRKEMTPEDLKDPASAGDVQAVFRHEVGHLMRRDFNRGAVSTPSELASEIVAWQHAIENSPNHQVEEKFMRKGLLSHAYAAFRRESIKKEFLQTGSSWDREERAEIMLRQETSRRGNHPWVQGAQGSGPHIAAADKQRALKFTARAMKALRNYGAVLRKRGTAKVKKVRDPFGVPKRYPPYPTPGGPGLGF